MRKATIWSLILTVVGLVGALLSPHIPLLALFGAMAFTGSAIAGHALIDETRTRVDTTPPMTNAEAK